MTARRASGIRWLKFNAVGGLGIVVQLAALTVATRIFQLNYLVATALAVEAAVIHNYLWHERYTWADRPGNNSLTRFLRFNLTTGTLSILGNIAVMRILVGVCKMNYLAANVVTIATCSIANYLLSDRIVFQRTD